MQLSGPRAQFEKDGLSLIALQVITVPVLLFDELKTGLRFRENGRDSILFSPFQCGSVMMCSFHRIVLAG